MASCKDCIGNDYCFVKPLHPRMMEKSCKKFKNKAYYAEVKHGEWIYDVKYYSCSICAGIRFNLLLGTDAEYCPYCGAKMDGVRKEDV